MIFYDYDFIRKPDESLKDYKKRCYIQKVDSDLTWSELAKIMNNQLNEYHSDSTYRKEASLWNKQGKLNNTQKQIQEKEAESAVKQDLADLILEFKKERIRLSEERTQNNAYIRKMAREDTLRDIAEDFANKMTAKKLLPTFITQQNVQLYNKEAIVCISDWHYGLDFQNAYNTYNPEICKERVAELRDKIIEIGKANNIRKLYIVNLSDLIAGRIHLTIRLESRFDVISQVMEVSEILAEFLTDLSRYFEIEYRDTMDNHSRLEPNKKDSLELETLVRIIPWYLKQRLVNNTNISIIENDLADDIITFTVFNYKIAAVHGHKDKPNKVIENMSAMTRRRNDLVLTAHLHHFFAEQSHECLHLSNGSLMGTDTFAQDLRLTNKPSQLMIICSEDNIAEAIYKIDLH